MASAFRLFVCFLIATFCFCSTINAAAVHNSIIGDKLAKANQLGDAVEKDETSANIIRARRSTIHVEDSGKICRSTTPCGWAIYVPFRREIDYFMKNTCLCPDQYKCIRMEDDLSVSAYVYRCKNVFTPLDIDWPSRR